MLLAPNQVLDIYRIEALIQTGGMGEVYKVFNTQLNRFEALKILKPELGHNHEFVTRFIAEAQRAAQLDHNHIVPIYRIVEQEKTLVFFTMKYIEGDTLSEVLQDNGPLDEDTVCDLIAQIARALDYAHQQGVVHRDIKPANVMIDQNAHLYLLDFGIAKTMLDNQSLTKTGTQMGTSLYMSPEQAQNAREADARSDLYSLGVMMFQMLTGELPFDGESEIAVALKHIQEKVPDPRALNSEISVMIRNVVLKLLEKDPQQRFQNAREFLIAIKRDTRRLNPLTNPGSKANVQADKTILAPGVKSQPALTSELPNTNTPAPKKTIFKPVHIGVMIFLGLTLSAGVLLVYSEHQREQNKATLSILVFPAEAKITLEGNLLPDAQPTRLEPGDYVLSVRAANYDSVDETVHLAEQQKLERSITLQPSQVYLESLMEKANVLYEAGDFSASVMKFNQILNLQPGYQKARTDLVNLYINRAIQSKQDKKFEEVLVDVNAALKTTTAPNRDLAKDQREMLADLLNSVAVNTRSKNKQRSLELLDKAMELFPMDIYKNNIKRLK